MNNECSYTQLVVHTKFFLGKNLSSDCLADLEERCNEFTEKFNNKKYYNRTAKFNDGELIISADVSDSFGNKYKDKERLKEATLFHNRSYYPFFFDYLKNGTCFIYYMYFCVVSFCDQKKLPFILNGPFLQIQDNRIQIHHWIRCLPLTWFSSLLGINFYKKISLNKYYKLYNTFFNNGLDSENIDKVSLYSVDLERDFFSEKIETIYTENNEFVKFRFQSYNGKEYYSSELPICLKQLLRDKSFAQFLAKKHVQDIQDVIDIYSS